MADPIFKVTRKTFFDGIVDAFKSETGWTVQFSGTNLPEHKGEYHEDLHTALGRFCDKNNILLTALIQFKQAEAHRLASRVRLQEAISRRP